MNTSEAMILLAVLFAIVMSALTSWRSNTQTEKAVVSSRVGKILARFGIFL